MNQITVPRTRITLPRRRSDLITRPRLLSIFKDLLDKKLFLVAAPAGYGKTSLLVDFAVTSNIPVCWYSINNPPDSEPLRFLTNLITSIQLHFNSFGHSSLSALQNGQGKLDIEYLANIFIDDLYKNVSEHFIIVLDDYHLVNDNLQIREFISRVLQNIDENCHFIITSRSMLSLPVLPLMVAHGEVGGISLEELAFQKDEIQDFFIQNQNHAISEIEADKVFERTEGWITGIVLDAQLRVNPQGSVNLARLNRVSGVGADDYFLALINNQPPEIRNFLLRSSLLDDFDANRCHQIIGKALSLVDVDWQGLIWKIQQNNLFVLQVGEEGNLVRYHQMFSEFLQARVAQEQKEEFRTIELRLAELCIENKEWEKAFSIYRKLKLAEDLVNLVELAGPDLLANGQITTIQGWMDALPPDVLRDRPSIITLQGMIASTIGDKTLALSLFDEAVEILRVSEDRKYYARALVWRAGTYRMMGKYAEAIKDSRETINLVGKESDTQKDIEPDLRKIKAEALRTLGICADRQGNPNEALRWLKEALAVSHSIKDEENSAVIRLNLGLVHEKLGSYSQAKEMYEVALNHWRVTQNPIWLSNLLNNLGVLEHLTGNYQQAIATLEEALRYARSSGYARLEAFILTGIGDIYGELQAFDEAVKAYDQARSIALRQQENFLQVYINVQQAAFSASYDMKTAVQLIDEARNIASRSGSIMESYLCDLEHGGMKILQGKPRDALQLLEKACSFFEKEGQKVQSEKANLYLVIAYGALSNYEKLYERLIKILASLNSEYSPVSLIAACVRFKDHLTSLNNGNYVGIHLEDIFDRIDRYEKQLPHLRRYLRQHAVSVPFAPPILYIRALGKMQVKINNQVITDWRVQAARDLFFLLLAHPEGLKKEEIGLIFWPDVPPEEVRYRVKNTVYRLRHSVGKNAVSFEQEYYLFNDKLDYDYDVEQFLRENAQAQQALDENQKLTHFREAIKLYKGPYLPEINEPWVFAPRDNLQQIYLNILLQVAEIYMNAGNNELALDYINRALNEDNCLEAAYRLSLKIYAALGNRAAVVRQYQRLCEVLQREINAEPSQQTQALYQDLLK